MKVALIQAPIGPMRVEENRASVLSLLAQAMESKPDVIVLPEMWNTGFYPEVLVREDDYAADRLKVEMAAFARKHRVALVGGSLTEIVDGARVNRAYVFDKTGRIVSTYDKAHLFSPGGEHEVFRAGDRSCRFPLTGVACGMVLCYDLRFPEWVRLAIRGESKILFVPMAWHLSRIEHMHLFARARAVENQCFVVATNCTKLGDYPAMGGGGSCVFAPDGRALVMADQAPGVFVAELDLGEVEAEKAFFDLWKERRSDIYGDLSV
ncbi:putative amidohydrolase [Peptoniphilus ivorii]|uniref:nitrilase-related carbon-nitrogen hydrolase n=1 Tax=Aedoeadaptatus ivorii TaxID=54006 RepID=UPI0027870B19|nr:nitrilase-related carbon-nitrogen hydrolase [Peptoniphilus ivorii]MDQ0508507.1 putative amidohydrolase [Peptoniphilus ivorii]